MPEEGPAFIDDLVVVSDSTMLRGRPRSVALARAAQWCSEEKMVTIWRGPDLPDETAPRKVLKEVACRTVLVDDDGFYVCIPKEIFEPYPCPQMTEELEDLVEKEARDILTVMANERAAESFSYVDQERGAETFGDEVLAVARFGDAVAVDGRLVTEGVNLPRGWVETDLGGRVPGGEEEEIQKEWIIDPVVRAVSKKLEALAQIEPGLVERIIDKLFNPGKDWIMWSSDSGDTGVWTSRRAMRKFERAREEERREAEERRSRETREVRLREIEERRAAIRRGGWPGPREWSPRGKLPGER